MRAYRLALLPKSGIDISSLPPLQFYSGKEIILTQNMNNNLSDNINIEFDLQQLVNDETKEVFSTSTITLYNVNRYWHNENAQNAISNAKISLCAGTKATPMLRHQGLVDTKNTCYALNDNQITTTPIYDGYVANSYANMDGASTVLVLNLIPVRELTEDEKASVNQLNIYQGTEWRNDVKKFIENYLLLTGVKQEGISVKIGAQTKGSLTIAEADVYSNNIEGIFETKRKGAVCLADYVKKAFNEVIKKQGNTIYIGEPAINKIDIISDKDLLGQPQLINPNTITLTVPLTSKFRILQKIQLKLESFIGYGQAFVTEGDPAGFGITAERIGKMYEGIYQITTIRYVLQSRNTDVNAWCAILEAVKVNKNISFLINKSLN